jgi:hypothetical protein
MKTNTVLASVGRRVNIHLKNGDTIAAVKILGADKIGWKARTVSYEINSQRVDIRSDEIASIEDVLLFDEWSEQDGKCR